MNAINNDAHVDRIYLIQVVSFSSYGGALLSGSVAAEIYF
jgi:hypothetical protein